MDLGDVDMEVTDRIGLELALVGLVALDLWQAGDTVALQAAVQRRAGQVGDRRLQGVEAVVERQERVPPKGNDDRLLFDRQHGGFRVFGTGRQVCDRATAPPLGDGLRIDAVAPGQNPQALLTMLYRSTDRLCRRGAAVENLAHSASFHSMEYNAPSKPGIKQLGGVAPRRHDNKRCVRRSIGATSCCLSRNDTYCVVWLSSRPASHRRRRPLSCVATAMP